MCIDINVIKCYMYREYTQYSRKNKRGETTRRQLCTIKYIHKKWNRNKNRHRIPTFIILHMLSFLIKRKKKWNEISEEIHTWKAACGLCAINCICIHMHAKKQQQLYIKPIRCINSITRAYMYFFLVIILH